MIKPLISIQILPLFDPIGALLKTNWVNMKEAIADCNKALEDQPKLCQPQQSGDCESELGTA